MIWASRRFEIVQSEYRLDYDNDTLLSCKVIRLDTWTHMDTQYFGKSLMEISYQPLKRKNTQSK